MTQSLTLQVVVAVVTTLRRLRSVTALLVTVVTTLRSVTTLLVPAGYFLENCFAGLSAKAMPTTCCAIFTPATA